MAKTSVLQRPKVDVNSGRHDFDRSYFSNFNQSHGELRAVLCEPCIAGTKGVINVRRFTRTAQVVFPAFQQVDQHIEFFKVPLRYLWSKWNDWKLNINDLNSSRLAYWDAINGAADLSMNYCVPCLNIGSSGGSDFLTRLNPLASQKSMIIKMVDDLNLGVAHLISPGGANMVNLFKLAAYQKVYFDHFRNSTYENNDPYAYNLDWLMDNGGSSAENVLEPTDGTKQAAVTMKYFTIRYKNYRNDYYHNIYPSLNYSQSQPTGQDWTLPNNVQGVANLVNPGDLSSFVTSPDSRRWQNYKGSGQGWGDLENAHAVNTYRIQNCLVDNDLGSLLRHDHVVNDVSQTTGRATISVQQVRAMFALDKLMRASAYAPKHVKEQFEARYGVKMSDKVSFESEKIGSFKNDIVFGEVTSTSNTFQSSGGVSTGDKLGAIGGKGIGAGDFGGDLHFYCEEDSIIIGIQYFLARANYDNMGIDEWQTKLTRNDFFIREYEHLGLRPLYKKQFYANGVNDNIILGFQEANMVYKTGIDRNHGLFNNQYYKVSSAGTVSSATSELANFVVHSNSSIYINVSGGVPYTYFKAFPSHLDAIFAQNYDELDQSTDQFYGNLRFKFMVNAPMDVHSQPYL